MSLIDNMRTKLTAIADAVRTKNGATDTYTLDGIATAILALEIGGGSSGDSGGSGGSSSGGDSGGSGSASIENGYTVNFYDADKVTLLESHSAKCGNWIDAPLSISTQYWRNIDSDYANSFPLKLDSAGTVNLYSSIISYTDLLYSKFGIDKAQYPYITIHIEIYKGAHYYWIFFAKSIETNDSTTLKLVNCMFNRKIFYFNSSDEIPFSNTDSIGLIKYILNNAIDTSLSSNSSYSYSYRDTVILHTNFDCNIEISTGKYRFS